MNYPDGELTYYLHENNDVAADILYDKYKYIIDVLLYKYKRVFYALNIDINDVRQEANLAFSYAIYHYDESKDASLTTFINLCVERKIRNIIKKYETDKSKVLGDTISLDGNTESMNLENVLGDDKYEPLRSIESLDTLNYINKEVPNILSSFEIEVYKLMILGYDYIEIASKLSKTSKQIDNTIQRIRKKIRSIL